MSAETLLLACAATFPVAAVALAAASLAERCGADAALRCRIWTGALAAATLAAVYVLVVDALQLSSPLALFGREAVAETVAADGSPVRFVPEPSVAVIDAAPALVADSSWRPTWAALVLLLIAGGAVARLGLLAGRLASLARLLATSRPLTDEVLERGARRWGGSVRVADTSSPILAGWRRPTILIPEGLTERLGADELYMICRHEWAHLERGDNRRVLVEEAVLALFWFNPLLGLIRRRLADAREEACDARVVADEAAPARKAYARTLVESLKDAATTAPLLAFIGRRAAIRRRVAAILRGPRQGSLAATPAGMAAIFASFLTAWFVPVAFAATPQTVVPERKLGRHAMAPAPRIARFLVPSPPPRPRVRIEPGLTQQSAAEFTGAAQVQPRPAPIDYARPPGVRAEDLIQITCTLTEAGQATGCAATEPGRDPSRVASAIAEIGARSWRIGDYVEEIPGGRTISYGAGENRQTVRYKATRIITKPGPMTFWLHPDGKVAGGPPSVTRLVHEDPAMELRLAENMRASIARSEQAARQAVANRANAPTVMRDEDGRVIARRIPIEKPGDWPGAPTTFWDFAEPAPLKLDGRVAGRLYTDANNLLTFNGRREVYRDTPVPVWTEGGVVRLRANIGALQPGDTAMFPFAPILSTAEGNYVLVGRDTASEYGPYHIKCEQREVAPGKHCHSADPALRGRETDWQKQGLALIERQFRPNSPLPPCGPGAPAGRACPPTASGEAAMKLTSYFRERPQAPAGFRLQ